MSQGALPRDWEAMPYHLRVGRAVQVGRESKTDAAAARMLRAWRTGGFTQRLLAVYACQGSRDVGTLVESAADPSARIARLALAVLRVVGDDESLLKTLESLPSRRLPGVLARLRGPRPAVVDRLLASRMESGDSSVWPLAPYGTAALVDGCFQAAAERGGWVFQQRLAKLHPSRAAAEIVARLNILQTPDFRLFAQAQATASILADRAPDAALQVLAALRPHLPLAAAPLQTLLLQRPTEVADLVLAAREEVHCSFAPVVARLGTTRVVALHRRSTSLLGSPERWLKRLPGAERAAIYMKFAAAWTSADGLLPLEVLRLLPTALRIAEAREVVVLPRLAAEPLYRLLYVSLLPWDEANVHAATWLGHPEADHRAAALSALCETARYEPRRLPAVLDLLVARRHEQDPVRQAFLTALAALPPGRFRAEHLPSLTRVVQDALDAADLSVQSTIALSRLVFALLPFHPEWAAERLAALSGERSVAGWGGRPLTPQDVRRIAPALTPIVRVWARRENDFRLVGLAGSVGRRLRLWPELIEALEWLTRHATSEFTAATAMSLLLRNMGADAERIATAALKLDGSWVFQGDVLLFLHARRQDLLTPFLGTKPISGRFSTGAVRRILPLYSGFHRWTDFQQETFATSLAELAAVPKQKKDAQATWDVLDVVRRLPALPAIGPERLVALARDPRPPVLETAVRALGRMDARQGVPELLEALGDARARYAVYALRAALSGLPASRALDVMRSVPLEKVTVAKEAIRLAGEFGGKEALQWFIELDQRPLHRDVRGALLRALWDHLEHPEAWKILDAAAESPEVGVVIGLARIQADRASDAARERVLELFLKLLDHPEPTVRLAVVRRSQSMEADPKRKLLTALLAKLRSRIPDERLSAFRIALVRAADADATLFEKAFRALLPKPQRLLEATEVFAFLTPKFGARLFEVRSAVLAVVESSPPALALAIRLAAARHAAAPFTEWARQFVGGARWHVGTQTAILEGLVGPTRPIPELEEAEALWAASPDASARWIALRLLVKSAAVGGWTSARRARLKGYRSDPDSIVSDEAAFIFPHPKGRKADPNGTKV